MRASEREDLVQGGDGIGGSVLHGSMVVMFSFPPCKLMPLLH